jgi:hypothetical protein
MQRHLMFALCLILVLTALPATAQTVLEGSTGGGAFYKIVVPESWNGDLVVWNHGFSLTPPAPSPDLGPLQELQLAEGYAIAASSYRLTGWAVFKTKNDLQAMVGVFKDHFGRPSRIFLTGASLGGIVTAAAIEEANLGNVVGALTICGAMGGSRNWDAGIDLRLVYDAVCSDVPGAFIPGGAEGLPKDFAFTNTDLALAVNACTGILAPPTFRTPQQAENLDRILTVARIPESFLLTDMGFATFGMGDLVHDRLKLNGKVGTGNEYVFYGDPLIDAAIERVKPHPGAANRLSQHYTPNGFVGATKIVSLHTDKDGLVVVENESEYAAVVPAENLTTGIVVEAEPSHCGFTPAETVAGWLALQDWVAGAPQPSAATLQGYCGAVAPLFGGPCRIDPTFVVPDMDDRIRPR